jgi:E3 ubiquitin-protein ligase MARCH1/8
MCRICYDEDAITQRMIRPCKCAGSVQYVHEDCLKLWIVSHGTNLTGAKCEICQTEFKMQIF